MKLYPSSLIRVFGGIITISICSVAAQAQTGTPSTAPSPASPPGTAATTGSTATSGTTTTTASGMPNEAEMMKMMMEMAKLNDNHKLLASLDGTWNFTTKMWMSGDPTSKPEESKGTAVRKSIMGGRFVAMDVNGKFKMPDETGKMKEFEFKGQGLDAYDNGKQKFVSSWIDNMGTGIMMAEGTYDAATKTFTYNGEYTMGPGMKQQIKEVIKLTDKDHMVFEWYENRGGKEVKTMEISYTRSGKK